MTPPTTTGNQSGPSINSNVIRGHIEAVAIGSPPTSSNNGNAVNQVLMKLSLTNQSVENLTTYVATLESEIKTRRETEAALEKQLVEAKRFKCVHINGPDDVAHINDADALPN